jgi:hypothetical protein
MYTYISLFIVVIERSESYNKLDTLMPSDLEVA